MALCVTKPPPFTYLCRAALRHYAAALYVAMPCRFASLFRIVIPTGGVLLLHAGAEGPVVREKRNDVPPKANRRSLDCAPTLRASAPLGMTNGEGHDECRAPDWTVATSAAAASTPTVAPLP